MAKKFDEDEAIATAEQFVEFCTGRAWILTDVGATDTEPRYGFAHRTFMEYFAAEHLVRTRPTAHQLWEALRPRVLAGEWEVVAQIALQLLDRNVDGGTDDLLRMVLAETPVDLHQRSQLHGFAAPTLGYVHPGHDVIREVTAAVLHATLEGDISDRFHYWIGTKTFDNMTILDDALHTLMYQCSAGNLPVVRRTLTTILEKQVESGSETALYFVVGTLVRHRIDADERTVRIWQETHRELYDRNATALTAWRERAPWASIPARTEPDRLITRFGPWPLYLAEAFLTGSIPSVATFPRRSMTSVTCA